MRALILDGGDAGDARTACAAEALAAELTATGYEVERELLRERDIRACRGCFNCWIRTPGECVIRDDAADILRRYIGSDVVAYVTPVTFGGYAATLKMMVDRVIPLIDPRFTRVRGEYHHRVRYERYPQLVGFGTLPAPDAEAEASFVELLRRNGLNIHADAPAVVLTGDPDPAAARAAAARLLAASTTKEVAA